MVTVDVGTEGLKFQADGWNLGSDSFADWLFVKDGSTDVAVFPKDQWKSVWLSDKQIAP